MVRLWDVTTGRFWLRNLGRGRLWLWDVATGRLQGALREYTGEVNSVAFSPDGTTLASGNEDTMVRVWDVATGRLKDTLTGHTGEVNSVAFSPDGTTLATGSKDGTVLLWELTAVSEPSRRSLR